MRVCHLRESAVPVDEYAVGASDREGIIPRDSFAVYTGAFLVLRYGLTVSVYHGCARAGFGIPDCYEVLVIRQGDSESVVRIGELNLLGFKVSCRAFIGYQVCGVVYVEGAGTVCECRNLTVIGNNMPGVVGLKRQCREAGSGGVVV